jgi:hypothetical protein
MAGDSAVFSTLYPSGDYPGTVIQSPRLDSKGKPTQRSIKDVGMARDVVKLVIQAGRNRSIVASRILAKYNAERPYDAYKLEAEGLGWKQNFTTKPLPSMIDKVAPRFTRAIDSLKYLTNSSLSNKWANSVEKTEKFRQEITKVIRKRKGWHTLCEDIAFTNALFGSEVVGVLDEFTWFPTAFKFDEMFLPDGTKSESRLCQVAVLKEVLLPHELYRQIENMEDAKYLGFNIENTIKNINEASPVQIRDRLNVGGTLEFWYQNALRELTIGASYMAGSSVIVVYNLLAREVNGKVSHYRLAGPGFDEIYSKDDRFESMEDCLCFFSYQKGNGTMQGSKGIGRDLYEMAGMIDRTRNEVVDRAIMSGKIPVQGDIKRIHTFKMSVIGMTVVFPSGWTFLEQKIDGNVEPFLKLDAYFSALADGLIGNVSPPQLAAEGGEAMRSPAAWNLLASREEEGKDSRIARFLEQFTSMVQLMQRRICNPDTIEDDAKEVQKELLKHMTREEINEIANTPVAETVRDLTPMERQMIVAVSAEKRGNPLYNQRQLEVESLTARVSTDFVDRVLLPSNDPTEEAEQHRLQQLESNLIVAGQAVPVSPRDNHLIHLETLMPMAEQMGSELMKGGMHTGAFEALLAHVNEHFQRAQEQNAPKEILAPVEEFLKKAGPALGQLKALDAQAEQVQSASDQMATQ